MVNKRRIERGVSPIPIVKKHSNVEYGIRASTNMNFIKCVQSMVSYSSNEFIFTWLYIGFLTYFLVQIFFLATRSPIIEL